MPLSKATTLKSLALAGMLVFSSCDYFKKTDVKGEPIARVGDSYLYAKDVAPFVSAKMSARDSAAFVVNYINRWASKQLLLDKSKINLPEEKLAEFNRLVKEYRDDLYTRAYKEALVQQSGDTAVTTAQLRQFYHGKKENFRLNEKLVQLHFVVLPPQFLDKAVVIEKMRSFEEEDKVYLDSIAVQFKKIHLNDSIWVSASRVMTEIPLLNYDNEAAYLKKSQFFELQDSTGVYLGEVTALLEANDIAPFQYVAPDIKQIILNKRKQEYLRALETEIIDEAIKQKEFEIYGKRK